MKDYSLITEEVLEKRFEEIPWVLQIISNSDNAKVVSDNIAEEHNLTEEQSLILGQLLGLVFNGFVKREEVATELVDMAELSKVEAREIYTKLNDRIFRHVSNELDKVYFPFFENGFVEQTTSFKNDNKTSELPEHDRHLSIGIDSFKQALELLAEVKEEVEKRQKTQVELFSICEKSSVLNDEERKEIIQQISNYLYDISVGEYSPALMQHINMINDFLVIGNKSLSQI